MQLLNWPAVNTRINKDVIYNILVHLMDDLYGNSFAILLQTGISL